MGYSASTLAQLRRRRLPPELRRAQLLDCAMGVFARRGLGQGRHAEIAREAGVSVSTVFVYFRTRKELVRAVLHEVERFLTEMAERIHAQAVPAPQVILEHAIAFAESVETHPDHARVWLDWSTAIREEVWPLYLQFQERVVRILEETILRGQHEGSVHPGVDAEADARLLVGSAHMLAQMRITHTAPEKVSRFIHTLVRAALGGEWTESPEDGPSR